MCNGSGGCHALLVLPLGDIIPFFNPGRCTVYIRKSVLRGGPCTCFFNSYVHLYISHRPVAVLVPFHLWVRCHTPATCTVHGYGSFLLHNNLNLMPLLPLFTITYNTPLILIVFYAAIIMNVISCALPPPVGLSSHRALIFWVLVLDSKQMKD